MGLTPTLLSLGATSDTGDVRVTPTRTGIGAPSPRDKPDIPGVFSERLQMEVRRFLENDPVARLGFEALDEFANVSIATRPGARTGERFGEPRLGQGPLNLRGQFVPAGTSGQELAERASQIRAFGFDDFRVTPDSILLINNLDAGVLIHEFRHKGAEIVATETPRLIEQEKIRRGARAFTSEAINRLADLGNPAVTRGLSEDPVAFGADPTFRSMTARTQQAASRSIDPRGNQRRIQDNEAAALQILIERGVIESAPEPEQDPNFWFSIANALGGIGDVLASGREFGRQQPLTGGG